MAKQATFAQVENVRLALVARMNRGDGPYPGWGHLYVGGVPVLAKIAAAGLSEEQAEKIIMQA
jgi:hypothetical protein